MRFLSLTTWQFGVESVGRKLPPFITMTFQSVVYGMLAHPQLSIRENATKAFSAYLFRSEFQEAVSAFNEAVDRLRGIRNGTAPQQFTFVDAYEAEGLLGVVLFIVKVVI